MTLSKKELQKILDDNGVQYHHRNGIDKLQELAKPFVEDAKVIEQENVRENGYVCVSNVRDGKKYAPGDVYMGKYVDKLLKAGAIKAL